MALRYQDKKHLNNLPISKITIFIFLLLGPDEIVFEAGGKLYLCHFPTKQINEVKVHVVTDQAILKPKMETAEKMFSMQH